jgi:hypothetical protein
MASENSTRTPNTLVVFLGTAAAFAVVAVVFGSTLAWKKPVDEVEAKRAAQRLATRAKLDTEAQARLDSLGWVDKAKGTVHVPIADGMKMVAADLRAKKPAPSSVKVEAPLPMPLADPKSAEPPPAALPSAPQGADTVRFPTPDAPAAPAPAPAAPAPAPAPAKPAEPPPAPAIPAAQVPEKPAEPVPAQPAEPAPTQPVPTPAPPTPAEKPAEPAPVPAPEKPAEPAPAPAVPPPAQEQPAAPPANPPANPEPSK